MASASSLYKSALGRLGLNFPDGLVGETNEQGVLDALNDALSEVAVDHDWLFTYSEHTLETVPGQAHYSLPSTWLRTSWLVMQDTGEELVAKQRRGHFTFTGQARPRWYDTSGDKIILAPVPDGAYVIQHGYFSSYDYIERNSDDFASLYEQLDEVDIAIPDVYRPLLVLYIAKNIALLEKDRESYQMVTEEIGSFRRRIGDNRRRHQSPGMVITRDDY